MNFDEQVKTLVKQLTFKRLQPLNSQKSIPNVISESRLKIMRLERNDLQKYGENFFKPLKQQDKQINLNLKKEKQIISIPDIVNYTLHDLFQQQNQHYLQQFEPKDQDYREVEYEPPISLEKVFQIKEEQQQKKQKLLQKFNNKIKEDINIQEIIANSPFNLYKIKKQQQIDRSTAFKLITKQSRGVLLDHDETQIMQKAMHEDNLIKCKQCKQKFNKRAIDKHEIFCKNKFKEKQLDYKNIIEFKKKYG